MSAHADMTPALLDDIFERGSPTEINDVLVRLIHAAPHPRGEFVLRLLPGLRHPHPKVREGVKQALETFIARGNWARLPEIKPKMGELIRDPIAGPYMAQLAVRLLPIREVPEVAETILKSNLPLSYRQAVAEQLEGVSAGMVSQADIDRMARLFEKLARSPDPILRAYGILGTKAPIPSQQRELSALLSGPLEKGLRDRIVTRFSTQGVKQADIALDLIRAYGKMPREKSHALGDLLARVVKSPVLGATDPQVLRDLKDLGNDPNASGVARVLAKNVLAVAGTSAGAGMFADAWVQDTFDRSEFEGRLLRAKGKHSAEDYASGLFELLDHPESVVRQAAAAQIEEVTRDLKTPFSEAQLDRLAKKVRPEALHFWARYARDLKMAVYLLMANPKSARAGLLRGLMERKLRSGEISMGWESIRRLLVERGGDPEMPVEALELAKKLFDQYPVSHPFAKPRKNASPFEPLERDRSSPSEILERLNHLVLERIGYEPQVADRKRLMALVDTSELRNPALSVAVAKAYEKESDAQLRDQLARLVLMSDIRGQSQPLTDMARSEAEGLIAHADTSEITKEAMRGLVSRGSSAASESSERSCERTFAVLRKVVPRVRLQTLVAASPLAGMLSAVAFNRGHEAYLTANQHKIARKPLGLLRNGQALPDPTPEEFLSMGTLIRQLSIDIRGGDADAQKPFLELYWSRASDKTPWATYLANGFQSAEEPGIDPLILLSRYRSVIGPEFDQKARELGLPERFLKDLGPPALKVKGKEDHPTEVIRDHFKDRFLQLRGKSTALDKLFAYILEWHYRRLQENNRRLGGPVGGLSGVEHPQHESSLRWLVHGAVEQGYGAGLAPVSLDSLSGAALDADLEAYIRGRFYEGPGGLGTSERKTEISKLLLNYGRYIPGGLGPVFERHGLKSPEFRDGSQVVDYLWNLFPEDGDKLVKVLRDLAKWQLDHLRPGREWPSGKWRDAYGEIKLENEAHLFDYMVTNHQRNRLPFTPKVSEYSSAERLFADAKKQLSAYFDALDIGVEEVWGLHAQSKWALAGSFADQVRGRGVELDFTDPFRLMEGLKRLGPAEKEILRDLVETQLTESFVILAKVKAPDSTMVKALNDIVPSLLHDSSGLVKVVEAAAALPSESLKSRPFNLLSSSVKIDPSELLKPAKDSSVYSQIQDELFRKGYLLFDDDKQLEDIVKKRGSVFSRGQHPETVLGLTHRGSDGKYHVVIREQTDLLTLLAELRHVNNMENGVPIWRSLEGILATERDVHAAYLEMADQYGVQIPWRKRAQMLSILVFLERKMQLAAQIHRLKDSGETEVSAQEMEAFIETMQQMESFSRAEKPRIRAQL